MAREKDVKLSEFLADAYYNGLMLLNNALTEDRLSCVQYKQKMYELNRVYLELLHECNMVEGC